MPAVQHFYYRIPDFQIVVNGVILPPALTAIISNIIVDDHVDLPSMFAFELGAAEGAASRFAWQDNYNLFAIGHVVEIRLGYEKPASLIRGEITALEPEFSAERLPRMTVRGYDRRHRLQRGCTTRTFVRQKDSDIVRQIAAARGLRTRVEDSKTVHEFVIQADQSDWAFLSERARRIDYELVMERETLLFRERGSKRNEKPEPLTLGKELTEFHPRLSTAGQVSEVVVRAWDPNKNEAIMATATGAKVRAKMGAQKNGPALVAAAFGEAIETLSAPPPAVNDAVDAAALAAARLTAVALGLIQGEGVCAGLTEIRAGSIVDIAGVGKRFSGEYYVASASHRYQNDGYATHITVLRSGS